MKQTAIFLLFFLFHGIVFGQLTKEQRIQDSVIGWDAAKKYDHNLKPQTTTVGKKREQYVNDIVGWVKASYTPVAGLGEYSRYVADLGFGVNFSTWNVSFDKRWLDEKGHFKPIPEEFVPFNITANRIYGAYEIAFISSPARQYMTLEYNGYTLHATEARRRKDASPTIDASLSDQLTWMNEWCTVYLTPDHKFPLKTVSKAELLDAAETGLSKIIEEKIVYAKEHWPASPQSQRESIDESRKEIDGIRKSIIVLRQRYSDDLNQPAVISTLQPTWQNFEANDWDIFRIPPGSTGYPVYKIDSVMIQQMKTATPLWIAVSFPYELKTDGNRLYEMFRSMTQHLDYTYIENYFFHPQEVAGKPYRPRQPELLTNTLENYKRKGQSALQAKVQSPQPLGVYFIDNISEDEIGSEPANWFFKGAGQHPFVASVDGLKGKWIKPGYGNSIYPLQLKTPLPQNFSLELDLATDPFTEPTGGALNLYLSTRSRRPDGTELGNVKGSTITIKIEAGDERELGGNNYRGILSVQVHDPSKINTENNVEGLFYTTPLRIFNSRKRSLHIKLELQNGKLRIYGDNQLIADSDQFLLRYDSPCVNCNVLRNAVIGLINFGNTTTDWTGHYPDKNVGCYISNIVLKKL